MFHPISKKLIKWYAQRKRSLPWRDHPHAYAVWVAEIMAQQTRLETMLPYFKIWMKQFPDIKKLAEADIQDVLKAWEGLGYYQRARNLKRSAGIIESDLDGKFPEEVDQLTALPGIGPYTAGAIASIAFHKDEAAVDGNAARVIARLVKISDPINESVGLKQAWAYAREILPKGRASDFNQALMDLGANICIPRNPKCEKCPLVSHCEAFRLGIQQEIPKRKKTKRLKVRFFLSGIIEQQGKVLVRQRKEQGLLGGLWEFPNVEIAEKQKRKEKIYPDLDIQGLKGEKWKHIMEINHKYSHFEAKVVAFLARVNSSQIVIRDEQDLRWVSVGELDDLPMGKIDRLIAKQISSDVG